MLLQEAAGGVGSLNRTPLFPMPGKALLRISLVKQDEEQQVQSSVVAVVKARCIHPVNLCHTGKLDGGPALAATLQSALAGQGRVHLCRRLWESQDMQPGFEVRQFRVRTLLSTGAC